MKQHWDELVKTALLGTEKAGSNNIILPYAVNEFLSQNINQNSTEINLLQTAALLVNYKNAGSGFPENKGITPTPAEAEILNVCNNEAAKLLGRVLEEDDATLIYNWLHLCAEKELRAPEIYLPALLNIGGFNPFFRDVLEIVSGKRAKWLAQFNPEWEYLIKSPEVIWDYGKPAERKTILQRLRNKDPEAARQLLEKSWMEENSKSKEDFLALLITNLSKKDEEFLQNALKEKSKSVKAAAWQLLLRIPDSAVTNQLWEKVKEWLIVKKSKSLLLINKTEIEINIPQIREDGQENWEVYLTVNQKKGFNFTPAEFILFSALSSIPLYILERHLDLTSEKINELFLKHNEGGKYLLAMMESTVRHKDIKWAKILLENLSKIIEKHKEHVENYIEMYFSLADLLPENERKEAWKKYTLAENQYASDSRFIHHLSNYALQFPEQWDAMFSVKVIKFLQTGLTDVYRTSTLSENILNLAPAIHPDALESVSEIDNSNEYIKNSWNKIYEKLKHKVELLEEIKKAFSD